MSVRNDMGIAEPPVGQRNGLDDLWDLLRLVIHCWAVFYLNCLLHHSCGNQLPRRCWVSKMCYFHSNCRSSEERHGKRRWVGWEKHDPSLLYRQSLLGRGQEYCGQWGGKGDKRGLCALAGRECPSVLEFPWCYLCLRLMVKLTGLLICLAVSGPWDQPHRIWFRAVNCVVWLLYSWQGQKGAGINGATLLLNCQLNSVTPYFTDLIINRNNEQNSLFLPNCVKGCFTSMIPNLFGGMLLWWVKAYYRLHADKSSIWIDPCLFKEYLCFRKE